MFAKVIASNYFGDSSASPLGNGGVVVLVPDAPLSLLNAPAITNAFKVSFTWTQGLNNGGSAVQFY